MCIRDRFPNAGNAAMPHRVLYYRNRIPVLNPSHISGFDQFLAGTTNVLGVGITGNIQMGLSFDEMPGGDIGGVKAGILFEKNQSTFNGPLNQWAMTSHFLMKAAIADPSLWTGIISYTEPTAE